MERLSPWYTRLRWRRSGAWMWPAFAVLTLVDAAVGHAWPSSGEAQPFGDALLSAVVFNLLIVALVSRPLGVLVRRVRRDLPAIVARDYAGTTLLAALAAALLTAGLMHRNTIVAHREMLRDAIVRAQAFIGDRAPAAFRSNLDRADTLTIEPGVYRTCVPSASDQRTYCVVVRTALPLATSVRFDGYESNRVFAAGMS